MRDVRSVSCPCLAVVDPAGHRYFAAYNSDVGLALRRVAGFILSPDIGHSHRHVQPLQQHAGDGRELVMMRWGFPAPPNVPGNRPMTNIRNTRSGFWRAWMKPENRVLVPATSFCEYLPGKPAVPHWFALGEDRPLFAFAGLWRPWTGTRGKIDGQHELYSFLTTEPNAVVAPSGAPEVGR